MIHTCNHLQFWVTWLNTGTIKCVAQKLWTSNPKNLTRRCSRLLHTPLSYFRLPSGYANSTPWYTSALLVTRVIPWMCECYPHIGESLKKLLASFFNDFPVPGGNVVLICSVLRSHEMALESVTPAYLNCLIHSLGLPKRMAYLWLATGYLDDNFR